MKLRLLAASVAALTLATGIAFAQDTTSEKGKLSYAFGYDFGRTLADSGEPVDVNTLVKAVQDGYAKKNPAIPGQARGKLWAIGRQTSSRASPSMALWAAIATVL